MLRALAFLALIAPGAVHAAAPIQDGDNFGIGIVGGAGVSGLSAKYFIGSDFAIQGMVGGNNPFAIDLLDTGYTRSGFAFELDALLESQPFVNGTALDLAFNYGAGVGISLGGPDVGIAIIGGFEMDFEAVPVDLVFEYRPNVWLVPLPTDWGGLDYIDWVSFAVHIRVYPFPAGAK